MAKLNPDIEKEIKEFKGQEKKGIERGVASENEWTEQDLAVKAGQPLVDSGTGRQVVIRMFDWKWDKKVKPEQIMAAKANKQQLFNSHAKYIRQFLWKDGLSIREDHDPKLIFTRGGYRIAIVCEARLGMPFDKRSKTLQDVLNIKK